MQQTQWIQRKFQVIADNGLLPNILERLEGTAARIGYKISLYPKLPSGFAENTWSVQQEIGHLLDLEPLWLKRAEQIIENAQTLEAADMTNEKTWKADHDKRDVGQLIEAFDLERKKLMKVYRNLAPHDLEKESFHPRLSQQMKLIDLAHFVAEHDDHHLAKMQALLEGQKQ